VSEQDPLITDLQALRIDRGAPAGAGRSMGWARLLRWPPWVNWLGVGALLVLLWAGGSQWALPMLQARVFRTEVQVTEISSISPVQASVELTSTGYVAPLLEAKIGPHIQGRIARMYVREGDAVRQGQVLFELDQSEAKTRLAGAKARLAAAQARVQSATASHREVAQQAERQRRLAQTGAASESSATDLEARADSQRQAIRVAEAEVKTAQAEVDALLVMLRYTVATSPMDGTVVKKPQKAGSLVGVMPDPVVEIADLSSLVVETDVPENRTEKVVVGGPAEIVLDAFPSKRFRGEVLDILPMVNRSKATLTVRVKFVDPTQGVLPDMAARVQFLQKPVSADALQEKAKTVVPMAAIAQRQGRRVVFVLDGNTARAVSVQTGEQVADGLELIEGPGPGTRIVRNPPKELQDGYPVKEKTE
jgi:HlyD family secretion protein